MILGSIAITTVQSVLWFECRSIRRERSSRNIENSIGLDPPLALTQRNALYASDGLVGRLTVIDSAKLDGFDI